MGGEKAMIFPIHLEIPGHGSPKDIQIVPRYFKFEAPIALHFGMHKVPQNLFYLSLFLCFDMSASTHVSKARMPLMLLQSCRMRAPNKSCSVCWDTQSALFKLLLLGTHEVLVNYSNQPQSRNSPSKQMAATAGSQETTFLFFMTCGCWQHFQT